MCDLLLKDLLLYCDLSPFKSDVTEKSTILNPLLSCHSFSLPLSPTRYFQIFPDKTIRESVLWLQYR